MPEAYLEEQPAAPVQQQTPPPPPAQESVSASQLSSSGTKYPASIRRLSDPRLSTHLLNLMDPGAADAMKAQGISPSLSAHSKFAKSPGQQALDGEEDGDEFSSPSKAATLTPNSNVGVLGSSLSAQAKQMGSSYSPAYAKVLSMSSQKMTNEDRDKKLFASVRQETLSATSNMRVPAMTAAVNSEHYDEVMTKSESFFTNLENNRAETFTKITDMTKALSSRIDQNLQQSRKLVTSLENLDNILENEKQKWQRQIEEEASASGVGSSSAITA